MSVPQGTEPFPRLGEGGRGTRSVSSCNSLVCPCGGRQGAEPTMLSQRADFPPGPCPCLPLQATVHSLPPLAILPEAAERQILRVGRACDHREHLRLEQGGTCSRTRTSLLSPRSPASSRTGPALAATPA